MTLTTFPTGGTGTTYTSPNAGLIIDNVHSTITLGELDFGTLGGGSFSPSALVSGQVLYWNGSDWIFEPISSIAVAAPIAGNGIAITGTVGAITISAKLNGTTLTLGSSGLALNLASANTWDALQTFSAGDFSFGGYGADSITAGAKGDLWYYNGTNIVNLPIGTASQILGISSGVPAWIAKSGAPVFSFFTNTVSTTKLYGAITDSNLANNSGFGSSWPDAGTISLANVFVTANSLGAGETYTVAIVNVTQSTSITVTFNGGVTGRQAVSGTLAVTANDTLQITAIASASSGSLTASVSFLFTPS